MSISRIYSVSHSVIFTLPLKISWMTRVEGIANLSRLANIPRVGNVMDINNSKYLRYQQYKISRMANILQIYTSRICKTENISKIFRIANLD